jgi:ribosome-binding factor A
MAEAIREVVATAILHEAADPRIHGVTVLSVEVSPDLRQAAVHVSVMGTEREQQLALRGLKHAAGFFQSKVASRLQTRFTPVLDFKLDDSAKKSIAISQLIDQALAADRKAGDAQKDAAVTGSVRLEDGAGDDRAPDDEDSPPAPDPN